jgi:hypothetical protein
MEVDTANDTILAISLMDYADKLVQEYISYKIEEVT